MADAVQIGTAIGTAVVAIVGGLLAKRGSVSAASNNLSAIERLEERLCGKVDAVQDSVDRVSRFVAKIDTRVERLEKHENGEWTPPSRWQEKTYPGIGPEATSDEEKDEAGGVR